MNPHMMFSALALVAVITSCAHSVGTPQQKESAYLHYQAKSANHPTGIPGRVYLFPPLLADRKGNPIEAMKPVNGPDGGILNWQAPNPASRKIAHDMQGNLKAIGYEVVGFEEVLETDQPHSILILSVLYSRPFAVDSQGENTPDAGILTKISARTFDISLDPATARGVSDLDGLTLCRSEHASSEVLEQSLAMLVKWLGDNVAGVQEIPGMRREDTS